MIRTLPVAVAATHCLLASFAIRAHAGLVGWWKFDEAAGSTAAADSSGIVPPATASVFNGGAFQPAAGKFGGALYLDGANDYAEVADRTEHKFPVAQSFSIALWFKSDGDETSLPTEYGNGQNQGLVTKTYFSTTYLNNYYHLQLTAPASGATTQAYFTFDSRLSTAASTPFRQPAAVKGPDPVNNAWHHLVAVLDRSAAQLRMYIDGTLYHSAATSSAAGGGLWDMGSAGVLVFGNHQNRYCRGWFDDIGIWNHALSTTEITSIFTNGIAGLGDTDNDGLLDSWEIGYFSNLAQTASDDPDTDGLTNGSEIGIGSNPTLADSDSDGLSDGAEVNTHLTSPILADTDADGLSDGAEINTFLTDPKLADTDGDNWSDGQEFTAGTDPLNPSSKPLPPPANVHLNEFVAENQPRPNDPTAPVDLDGDYPDWMEIKNNEATAVNLNGWQLSDDPANLAKWTFANTQIPAGGYLVVFASGKNRAITGVQPHTNFKLPSSGRILLSRPVGAGGSIIVSEIGTVAANYPSQQPGVSFGREDNTDAGNLKYFTVPTPGAANNVGSAVAEFVKDTKFSVDRGIFSAPFSVVITSATPGATIAYTLNGSIPTATNGVQIPPPDGLSPPSATVNISATTLLRARALKSGMGPSDTDTQTYLFVSEVLTQNSPTPSMGLAPQDTLAWGATGADLANMTAFSPLTFWGVNPAMVNDPTTDNRFSTDDLMKLPTLSLITDWKGLFGPNTAGQTDGGIYPPATGVAVEGVDRTASLELINPTSSLTDPNTVKGFQTDGNFHIFGGTSQNRWKSYKLSFRFQCATAVNYPVYGQDAFGSFNNFVLDATMNNTWMHPTDANQRARSAFVRDFVMADLQNRMGGHGFHSRPAHLYINGLYWGVYYLHEKPDHHFSSAYYGGDSDDYDVFKHSMHPAFTESDPHVNTRASNPALGVARPTTSNPAGNSTCADNFEALLDLLGTGNVGANPPVVPDLSIQANFDAVEALLDIDDFIDYMLLNYLAGNQDWADKNLYAARKRTGGKWRFFSWDAEHTFRSGTESFLVNFGNETNPLRNGNPKQIHNRLKTNADYRLRFADHIRHHMFNGGALTVANLTDAFNDRLDELNDAIRGESARWGHIRASLRSAPSTNIPFKKSDWLAERSRLTIAETVGGLSLIENRWNLFMAPTTGQFRQIANGPLYPSTDAPEFSQHGGSVPADYPLAIANPGGAGLIYFTLDGTDPRLSGGAVLPAAQIYNGSPVVLSSSTTVKARILNGADWSALTTGDFIVGAVPASSANLVISEINYDPSNSLPAEIAAGFADANDFEFVEILNISANRVDLTDLEFTQGITFHFNSGGIHSVEPGQRVLVVENSAAFAFRYGSGKPVAGEFEFNSNLNNGGETIALSHNNGSSYDTLRSFRYDDDPPWPSGLRGSGFTLVLDHPLDNPDHSLPQNWRPSAAGSDGTPGAGDTIGLAAWLASYSLSSSTDDPDHDGLTTQLEYLLGSSPLDPSSSALPTGSVESFEVEGVPGDYLVIHTQRRTGSDDLASEVQTSSDLATWTPAVRLSAVPNGDGTISEVWRSAAPVSSQSRAFIRLILMGL